MIKDIHLNKLFNTILVGSFYFCKFTSNQVQKGLNLVRCSNSGVLIFFLLGLQMLKTDNEKFKDYGSPLDFNAEQLGLLNYIKQNINKYKYKIPNISQNQRHLK